MIPEPAPDCWLHADVEVRPAPTTGHGLFATAAIPQRTVVSRLGGRLLSTKQLLELRAAAARDPGGLRIDAIAVADDVHLALPSRAPNGYGKHSRDPNLSRVGPYELAANRDIAAGEELTIDRRSRPDPGVPDKTEPGHSGDMSD